MTLASVCAALPPGEAGSESGLSLAGPPPPPRTDPVPRGPPAETAVCRPGVYWELCLFPAFPSSGGWEQPGPGGRPRGGSYWPAAPWGSPSAQPARPPALRAPPPPSRTGVPGGGHKRCPRSWDKGTPHPAGLSGCSQRESEAGRPAGMCSPRVRAPRLSRPGPPAPGPGRCGSEGPVGGRGSVPSIGGAPCGPVCLSHGLGPLSAGPQLTASEVGDRCAVGVPSSGGRC